MSNTDDMVYFQMPDGTKVSNDPRFGLEEALQKQLDGTEYKGDAGIHPDDQSAQTLIERPATMNSAQPGVGENDRPDDIEDDMYGPLGSPAQQRQKEDAAQAAADGASPHNTSTEDPEPVDSNEEVLQRRARRQKRRDDLMEKMEQEGEEPGDPEQPYSEWRVQQLKLEILRRNADRDEADQITLEKGAKRDDAVEALEADDAAHSAG
jgi:hypothetical protein